MPATREERGPPSSQVSICMYVTYPYIYNIRLPSSPPMCTGVCHSKSTSPWNFQKSGRPKGLLRQKARFPIQKQGYPENRGAKVFWQIILDKKAVSAKKWLYTMVGEGYPNHSIEPLFSAHGLFVEDNLPEKCQNQRKSTCCPP